jgi:Sec-independent protein translocase protein TatA
MHGSRGSSTFIFLCQIQLLGVCLDLLGAKKIAGFMDRVGKGVKEFKEGVKEVKQDIESPEQKV